MQKTNSIQLFFIGIEYLDTKLDNFRDWNRDNQSLFLSTVVFGLLSTIQGLKHKQDELEDQNKKLKKLGQGLLISLHYSLVPFFMQYFYCDFNMNSI
jgi:hypothetical protein